MQITTLDSMATNLNVITTQAHSNNLVEERTPSSVITDSYNYYKELRVAVYTVIYRFSSLASSLDYCDTNLLGRIIYTTRSGIPQNSEASECIVSPEKYSDLLNADEFSEELKLIISNEFASYQKMEANYKKWVVN